MNAKSGIHVWSLKKKLQEFINAENGVKFQSGEFTIADFRWQVIAYPNGNRFENYGSVMIYLKLVDYPSELPYGGLITVNFRIQCIETCSSNTYIETYTRINDSKGWSSKNLLLSDLSKESINKITFQIDCKVLKIINHNSKITYEAPLKIVKNKFALKWAVPDDQINRFQYANNGKWFESGTYSNLWCFKCAPNGYSDKNIGCALLFIQLCALPPNISKIRCKIKLYHVESGTKWTVKKDFGYDNKNAGWTKNKLQYDKLMKYDRITFRAEIEILALFDLNGNKSMTNPSLLAYDDTNIGVGKRNKHNIRNKSKRSQTHNDYNPYGGYGSHNYQKYFNDGYKKSVNKPSQNESNTKDNPFDVKDDEEDDDEDEDDEYESTDDDDDELELKTVEDIQEQVDFLVKEYKKLEKIIRGLKEKSRLNDNMINRLKNDIQQLKRGNNGKNAWKPSADIMTQNVFSAPKNNAGTPFSPQINAPGADTFDTGPSKADNGLGGWTTF